MSRQCVASLTAAVFAIAVISVCNTAAAEDVAVKERPSGIRPLGNVTIPDAKALKGKDPFSLLHDRPLVENSVLIPQLLASTNTVPPQYIYELARRLWMTDKVGSMEWLAVGMVRARYDSLRCSDKSAQQGIAFLALIAPDVIAGIKENRKAFSKAGKRALSRSDLYADSVSPMWICSHGIGIISEALQGKKPSESNWLRPSTEWPSLKSQVSTELDRYFEEQGNLPNEPVLANREALSANISSVADVPGSKLDQAFGQHGLFKMSIEGKRIWAKDSVIQSDGKIIVAMGLSDKKYVGSTALVRLKSNGTLDDQFGEGGVVSSKIGVNCRPEKVALLPSGKIVVAGWAHVNSEKEGITVTRYHANGALDESFADHGTLIFPKGHWSYVHAIAIQSDEKILVGGNVTIREQRTEGGFVTSIPHDHFFLARIDKNGVLDTDFGDRGLVATDVGGGGNISALSIQRDGNIIATGTGRRGSASPVIVTRYTQTGSLDKTFGNDGLVIRSAENTRYGYPSASVLSDGKLMVSYFSEKELFLNRLLPNGRVDSSFAESGQRKVAIGPLKYNVASLLLGGDNVLVSGMVTRSPAAGKSQPPYYYSIGVARFLSDGQGDSAFGPDGMQVLSIGAVNDRAASLMLQENGRIVLVGSSEDQTDSYLILLSLAP
jgi:uncharacterized delta-60 repeat protein